MALRDRIAPAAFDLLSARFEQRDYVIKGRRKLLAPAQGRVLEVGAGTGYNLPHYPEGVGELVITDSLDGMLRRAERRARRLGRELVTAQAPVERLPYPDASFDTVVGSLVLCSVDDQEPALAEIRRVLRPGGQYLFMEHVRSPDPKLARKQDRLDGLWSTVVFGCHPNRDTLARIEDQFGVEQLQTGEMRSGPRIVRPYVLGRAVKQGTDRVGVRPCR